MKLDEVTHKTNLNQGYSDGFDGKDPRLPDQPKYMSGYQIGQADRRERIKHLKTKRRHAD